MQLLRITSITSLITSTLAALGPHHKRQSTTTSSAEEPRGTSTRLRNYADSICRPQIHIFEYGTPEQRHAAGVEQYPSIRDLVLSLANSPFPCERSAYIFSSCTGEDNYENITPAEIAAERACLCPSKYWDYARACINCYSVHGYPQSWIEETMMFQDQVESAFCNATVPNTNYYGIEDEFWDMLPPIPSTGRADQFPSQTEVSLYYTEGVQPTLTSDTWVPGTAITATSPMDATSISLAPNVFTAPGPDGRPPPSPTSSEAAAHEVKAAGGIVVAIFGAMVML